MKRTHKFTGCVSGLLNYKYAVQCTFTLGFTMYYLYILNIRGGTYNITKLFAVWSVECRVSLYDILCRLLSDGLWSFQLAGEKIAKFG